MIIETIATRKYNGETYTFKLNKPEYIGETGVCGIELTPYISVETPDNGLGYTDTVLFNYSVAYTLNRYLQPWILKRITDVYKRLALKYIGYYQYIDHNSNINLDIKTVYRTPS